MKKNMGNADRIIRLIVAVIIAVLYFNGFLIGTTGIILLVIAAVFAITAFISICPLYSLFGIKTCAVKKAS